MEEEHSLPLRFSNDPRVRVAQSNSTMATQSTEVSVIVN